VNLGNAGRVEFRAPRGTLRLDRFMAKLEWVAAMVEYTRDATRRPVPGAFTQWALASGEYAEFRTLVADLMPGRVNPTRPAATRPTTSTTPAGSPDDQCAYALSISGRKCGLTRRSHNTVERGATHDFTPDPLIVPARGRCRYSAPVYPYGRCDRLTGHPDRHSHENTDTGETEVWGA
jgi:hypothetical protein